MRYLMIFLFCTTVVPTVFAEDSSRSDVINVLTGVLTGQPAQQQQPDYQDVYLQEQQAQLASMLQSGQYVTTRQGEPVDLMILGVPLTQSEHVYRALPVPPSRTHYPTGRSTQWP